MRWKVFHGRKSMICANRVLPRYMATPGWRHPERLCKPPFPIQVGDALCHSKSPAAIGFLTNTSQVNRTVLINGEIPYQNWRGVYEPSTSRAEKLSDATAGW